MQSDVIATENRHDYPTDVLVGSHTALLLFSAGFLGFNDGSFIRDAGLVATCVDNNAVRLEEMRRGYPPTWEFVCADVYEWAPGERRQWDVVSVDPWTNEFTRCADLVDVWCRLAKHAVILGTGVDTVLTPPDGWRATRNVWRSNHADGVYWTLLERA